MKRKDEHEKMARETRTKKEDQDHAGSYRGEAGKLYITLSGSDHTGSEEGKTAFGSVQGKGEKRPISQDRGKFYVLVRQIVIWVGLRRIGGGQDGAHGCTKKKKKNGRSRRIGVNFLYW